MGIHHLSVMLTFHCAPLSLPASPLNFFTHQGCFLYALRSTDAPFDPAFSHCSTSSFTLVFFSAEAPLYEWIIWSSALIDFLCHLITSKSAHFLSSLVSFIKDSLLFQCWAALFFLATNYDHKSNLQEINSQYNFETLIIEQQVQSYIHLTEDINKMVLITHLLAIKSDKIRYKKWSYVFNYDIKLALM